MRIVVCGEGNLVGRQVVERLSRSKMDVVALPRRDGFDEAIRLRSAVSSQSGTVVIDAAELMCDDEDAGDDLAALLSLMRSEAEAGVEHHVALSVVGAARRHDGGLFQGPSAREEIVAGSGVPYTIVRATQAFEDLGRIADASTIAGIANLSSAAMQPIASADIADALVRYASAAPLDGAVEIAGPELAPLAEFVGTWLGACDDPRMINVSADAPYFGYPLTEASLIPAPTASIFPIRFDDWLAAVMRPSFG